MKLKSSCYDHGSVHSGLPLRNRFLRVNRRPLPYFHKGTDYFIFSVPGEGALPLASQLTFGRCWYARVLPCGIVDEPSYEGRSVLHKLGCRLACLAYTRFSCSGNSLSFRCGSRRKGTLTILNSQDEFLVYFD